MKTQFTNDQYEKIYDDSMQFHYWNLYRNFFIFSQIKKFNLGNILDVGSGRGIVTNYLYTKNITIQGVELGDTTPIIKDIGAPISFNTDVFTLDKNLSINTITLFDVIEHLEQPIEFINGLILHFNNLKNILITVPARQELWTNFDVYNGHFKRYHLESLQNDFKHCKGSIVYQQYFFQILYYIIWLNIKILKQNRKVDFSRNKPMNFILRTFHNTIANLFKLEKYLFCKTSKGSSIILLIKV